MKHKTKKGNGNGIPCTRCHGTGTIVCEICSGRSRNEGGELCHSCNGKGRISCPSCNGSGHQTAFNSTSDHSSSEPLQG